jgi:hypothetical protein
VRPPAPKPFTPPEGDDTYQRALAALMGLVGRDVQVTWHPVGPTLLGFRGTLSVSSFEGSQSSEDELLFDIGPEGEERPGLLRVDRYELADAQLWGDCGCLLLTTVGGRVAILAEGCEHHNADDADGTGR